MSATAGPFRTAHVAGDVEAWLARNGDVFAAFRQQDSGCTAYGIGIDGHRWFVKVSREARAIVSLERAIAFHRAVSHPAIIGLVESIATDTGLLLVYPWVDGEVLYGAVLLDEGDMEGRFRGTEAMAKVLDRATRRDREQRYASVRELVAEWRRALGDHQPS